MQAAPALVKAAGLSYIRANWEREHEAGMNQRSRIFDDLGRLMNDAAGIADGVRREVETVVKTQAERLVGDMDLVKREDFDALRELVQIQAEEIAQLRRDITELRAPKAE